LKTQIDEKQSYNSEKAPEFGIIDCHMHLIGPQQQFPFSTGHHDKFQPWSASQYLDHATPLGISHCVITQTPFYGVDNSNLLYALAQLSDKARGIAVVNEHLSTQAGSQLQKAGVVGANFYLFENGELDWHCVAPTNERIQSLNWQTQLQFNGREIAARHNALKALKGNIVIDHIGKFQPSVKLDDPNFKALCKLLETGRFYIKLSAPYESSDSPSPFTKDAGKLAAFLIAYYPDYLIWGSNWPHLGLQNTCDWPNPFSWLACLGQWGASTSVSEKILTTNAKALFNF